MVILKKYILILSALVFSIFHACKRAGNENIVSEEYVVPLTKSWEKPVPLQDIPEGLSSLSAESCGSCHVEIFNEWKQSTHALAYKDLQFQIEWKKDSIYTCMNCHTPLQNQQEYVITGFINGNYKTPVAEVNVHFDRDLQQEGITCASCHVRNGAVIGTSGVSNDFHKTVFDKDFLSGKLCIGCHNLVDVINPVLVCSFETGDEFANNIYLTEGIDCISCHMPGTTRKTFNDQIKQNARSHHLPGSGIPKLVDMKIRGLKGLEIKVDSICTQYGVGDKLKSSLYVMNSFAGHNVPTGDPERFLLVTFKMLNSRDSVIGKKEYRIGEVWKWYPEAEKISDNNLKPGEKRTFDFDFTFQENGEFKLQLEITKHRMTVENARYNEIFGKYPLSIKIFERQYEIIVGK